MMKQAAAILILTASLASADWIGDGWRRLIMTPRVQARTSAPTDGMIAYWPFTGNALDSWGNHTGTVVNAVLTNGLYGEANGAYYFNGSSAEITVPYQDFNFSATQPYTVSAWIKPKTNAFTIIAHNSSVTGWFLTMYAPTFGFYFQANSSGSSYRGPNSSLALPTNEWVHIVATDNGGNNTNGMKTYVNGALASTQGYFQSGTVGTMTHTDPLRIGNRWNGSAWLWYGGFIDAVRIYTNALSAAQVLQIYNAEKP
jgi:hypothetical protein